MVFIKIRRGHNGMLAWAMATLNGHFECFKSNFENEMI